MGTDPRAALLGRAFLGGRLFILVGRRSGPQELGGQLGQGKAEPGHNYGSMMECLCAFLCHIENDHMYVVTTDDCPGPLLP